MICSINDLHATKIASYKEAPQIFPQSWQKLVNIDKNVIMHKAHKCHIHITHPQTPLGKKN